MRVQVPSRLPFLLCWLNKVRIKRMRKIRYTEEDFKSAVSSSFSIRELLEKLSLQLAGGNYKTVKLKMKKMGIDFSHFKGNGHLKGKSHNWAPKTPLELVLVENSTYGNTHKLRLRLIKENYFEMKCYSCENVEWMGKPIPLELEHKNGNNSDHRIENLTLLCPNCHALTSTYRGKNIRSS